MFYFPIRRKSRPLCCYRPHLELLETRVTPTAVAFNFGSSGPDDGNAVATDAAGNVYVIGSFVGSAGDFDPGPGSTSLNALGQDMFVAKYTSTGSFVWVQQIGGPGANVQGLGLATENAGASGTVFITGNFTGTVDFDPGAGTSNLTSAGGTDIFHCALNAGSGNLVWANAYGSVGNDAATAIVHRGDSSGGWTWITGYFTGSFDFDAGAGVTSLTANGQDMFVAAYDFSGNLQWARNIGSAGNDAGAGLARRPFGANLLVTGTFTGTADFDPGAGTTNLTSFGGTDAFVLKLDAGTGNFVWAHQLGGASPDAGAAIAEDSANNVLVTGAFYGTADFDPGPGTANLTSIGIPAFVAKLDASGNYVWARQFDGNGSNMSAQALALDSADNVFSTGSIGGVIDFDPGVGTFNVIPPGSGAQSYVSILDSAGNFIWAFQHGGSGTDQSNGIALAGRRLFTTGSTDASGVADFDPGPGTILLSSPGGGDPYVTILSPGVSLFPTGSTDVAEGGATDTYTVVLDFPPTADVLVTLNPGTQLSVPAVLTFTPTNFYIEQTVTVSAVDDGFLEGAHTGTITHTCSSADLTYNALVIATITANVTDNDSAAVTITPSGGSTSVTEGGATDTYTAILNGIPAGNVIVTVTPDAQQTVTPTTLTFTPATWNVLQTVTVTAVDDVVNQGLHSGVITHTSSSTDARFAGLTIAAVTTNVTDNDSPGVTVTQTGGATGLTEGGATDTYTLVLTTMPSATVVVTMTPSGQVTALPTTLTFTPAAWNVAQTVTVTAVDDFVAEGIHSGTLTHTSTSGDVSYNALVIAPITAGITDNDTAGVNIVPTGGATNLTEGGATDTYTVVLNSQPTTSVVVTLSPDSQVTAAPMTLTFTPAAWNVAQTVTVSAVDDAVFEGPHAGVVMHTTSSGDTNYNGLAVAAITATITDNDAPGLAFNPVSPGLSEGGTSATYTAALTSQPTADVVVAFNAGTQLTLASTTALTFTPANWNVPRTLTVSAIDDILAEALHSGIVTHSATSTDASYNLAASWTANITDNDFPGVTLSNTSFTLLEGSTRTYTAVLELPPLADVVVTLNPGPFLAVVPATLTFTPGNWNVAQVVVVTALDDALLQGTHAATLTHSASSADLAYNGLALASVTASILDNEGLVINGTAQPDRIHVTSSTDLSTILVSVNGKTSSYPSTLAQLVINSSGGADDIQIYNPLVPIVVIGGQQSDKVFVAGRTSSNAVVLDDAALTVNGMNVGLFEVESVVVAGSSADDDFTVLATPTFNVEFRGDRGSDRLQGADRPNTWKITNPSAGTLNANLKFSAIENLTGGADTDGFFFGAGRSIAGAIDGGLGNNKLDYGLYTSPVIVNLQALKATGVQGFRNIAELVGGKSTTDKLIGLDQVNLWNITNQNAGSVSGVSFQNIENLVGGQQDDTFRLGDNRGLKGKIDGGAGANVLDYGSYLSRAIAINLQLHTATNLGGFVNIGQVLGGAGLDTLVAANQGNLWTLTASNGGDVNGLAFSGFENLTGGLKNDSFNLSGGAWTGLLNGGTGSDTLASGGGAYTITGVGAGLLNGRKFLGIEYRF